MILRNHGFPPGCARMLACTPDTLGIPICHAPATSITCLTEHNASKGRVVSEGVPARVAAYMQAAAHSGPGKRQAHIKSARRQQRLNLLRSKHLLSVCNRAQ